MRCLNVLACLLVLFESAVCVCAEETAQARVERAVASVGGQDKLLRLFRITERLNVSPDPEKPPSTRVSILEPPKHWWQGKTDRVVTSQEPATYLVWAWTLQILKAEESKLEVIPDIQEQDRPAWGLRVTGSVNPALDMYFDQESSRLVRIDWRSDIHRFSDWQSHDGVWYPAKCIGYKKSTGKPWYFSEITQLERLETLPEGLERK